MVDPAVVTVVDRYLAALKDAGIAVEMAVIFGSQARGEAQAWSDIDLLVIAAQFDAHWDRRVVNLLWQLAARIDSRIEPLPCGSRQWRDDDGSAIIEIARREGAVLQAA
jgi:predicted nucleotidyltransferase